jgi:hypothetical protein
VGLDLIGQTVKEKEGKGRVTVSGLLVNYDPRELNPSLQPVREKEGKGRVMVACPPGKL